MRGKRPVPASEQQDQRIIPASAGQTGHTVHPFGATTDHPRECGANPRFDRRQASKQGSSPRVRGKLTIQKKPAYPRRIIPASAGQTEPPACRHRQRSDHPRECGANWETVWNAIVAFGSSPRVRGKRRCRWGPRARARIIPASAGQTSSSRPASCPATDHPRECGANGQESQTIQSRCGSSPRVRGKRQPDASRRRLSRIIPASAGQTHSRSVRYR